MQDRGVFVTYTVENFHCDFKETLALKLFAGEEGLSREFLVERLLVVDADELALESAKQLLTSKVVAVVVAGGGMPPQFLQTLSDEMSVSLFASPHSRIDVLCKVNALFEEIPEEKTTCHGTFIEAFGVGVMIQGDSSIGKSESALGLLDRGHRLITDDVVLLKKRRDDILVGSGPPLNKHMMEIRGIGIINVAHLYGAVCVRDSKSLDLIVKLEEWKVKSYYDRVGLEDQCTQILGVDIPFHVLPVKPGRDVVLLIETIVLNYRLKIMGLHSAREFNVKLLQTISERTAEGRL